MARTVTVCAVGLGLLAGCASGESVLSQPDPGTGLRYEINDTPLGYDEALFWAVETGEYMALQTRVAATENQDGSILADYGHARILWSGAEGATIQSLEIAEANLACPRGVFIGNPVEKVIAYYKSFPLPMPAVREEIYFEQGERQGNRVWRYGWRDSRSITYGVVGESGSGAYTHAAIRYAIQEGFVAGITYESNPELSDSEILAITGHVL